MRLECGWRHAQNRWSWEFKDFEKTSVGYSTVEGESWVFYRWDVRFSFSDDDRQRWIEILNITRCTVRWGVVSIVGLPLAFKNCVSFLVSKDQSHKLINCSYPKQQNRPVIAYVYVFVYVLYTTICEPDLFLFYSFESLLLLLLLLLFTPLEFFISALADGFFTGVWVTVSLLKSPGLFSVFWPFSIMLSFGWSSLVRQLPSPSGPLINL